jgi:hypothetical protein
MSRPPTGVSFTLSTVDSAGEMHIVRNLILTLRWSFGDTHVATEEVVGGFNLFESTRRQTQAIDEANTRLQFILQKIWANGVTLPDYSARFDTSRIVDGAGKR